MLWVGVLTPTLPPTSNLDTTTQQFLAYISHPPTPHQHPTGGGRGPAHGAERADVHVHQGVRPHAPHHGRGGEARTVGGKGGRKRGVVGCWVLG